MGRLGWGMKGITLKLALVVVSLAAVTVGMNSMQVGASDPDARATLRNADGITVGTAKLSQEPDGVQVKIKLDAPLATLTAGFHGFHIHANASATGCIADPSLADSTWFTGVGGHYKDSDPGHAYHGAHNGDLPVVLVNDNGDGRGVGELAFVTNRFTVADVIGRAFIVHNSPDNYRNIPLGTGAKQYTPNTDDVNDTTTATGFTAATGNAGSRMACGVIQAK